MPAALRPLVNLNLPHVWRAPELARAEEAVITSGHAALDAHLPGGGWPVGSLVDIVQEQPGGPMWQVLLPALAQRANETEGPVVLVDPPHEPFGASLHAQGLPLDRLLRIDARKPQAALWAAEQALRCADVAAVMAWLPRAKAADLRRLHLAAAQHAKLLFVFRGMQSLAESSPARLRLHIECGENLQLRILKRRGPPLEAPIELPAHPVRLAALLEARKGKAVALPPPLPKDRSHVLDRHLAVA